MDIHLQNFEEQSVKSDIRLMKTIHDLKNPLIACRQAVNDSDLTLAKLRDVANPELEDLEDMLENLRTEFKARNLMDLKEQPRSVNSEEFIMSLKSSHTRLAKNGNNILILETSEGFPINLKIQRLNTKRIINNLITNSLKHTNAGNVSVMFSIVNKRDIDLFQESDQHCTVGEYKEFKKSLTNNITENIPSQIKVDVNDDGKGIPSDLKPYIFDDRMTDQSDDNWDGTGLGLSICKQIIKQMNAFIKYKSEVNVGSEFSLFVPFQDNKGPKMSRRLSITSDELKKNEDYLEHQCNEVQFAEDNPNILNKYEKLMKKQSIPHVMFVNGLECFKYLNSLSCKQCRKGLIFTDMNMPQMDGLKLAQSIRNIKTDRNYTIVLVSAEEYDNKMGIYDQVQYKPILPKQIIEICTEINGINYNKDK